MLSIPKVYAITDRTIAKLSHSQQVRQFVEGGIRLIQLREKHLGPRDWLEDAAEAAKIARESNATLIVNDRVDVALAIDAHGVHLGQTDLPPDVARRLVGPEKIIGVSTHNLDQVADAMSQPVDYIAFGPIFPTTSKTDPDEVTGVEQLAMVRELVGKMPIVAIGGIDHSNANEVITAGADSVAVISCLLNNGHSITRSSHDLLNRIG